MQIHRCMPRPNNWTPASKYFKMPFSLLLIVFRPQYEETQGVAWRAMGPACPQPSSKAIKKKKKVHYLTRCDSGSKHSINARVYAYHILCWYGCQLCHHLHMLKRKGAHVFELGVITFHTQQNSQKTDSIKLAWNQQVWMNFVYFHAFVRYVLYVWGNEIGL